MKKVSLLCLVLFAFFAFALQNASTARYSMRVCVVSNEYSFKRAPLSFYLDFEKPVDLKSLKMTVTKASGQKKSKTVPVYAVPISPYKAKIYFMPHKNLPEDSELFYSLEFDSGKWTTTPCGSDSLKSATIENKNIVPNYSFENVKKTVKNFLTWDGRITPLEWRLQDFGYKFFRYDNIKSTCRVSEKNAYEGKRSLCFINGKPRTIDGREVLISGSAGTKELIELKPNTYYKLSFFMKITEQIDNNMNFQGFGVAVSFLDKEEKNLGEIDIISAVCAINSMQEEAYMNKWVYVETCEKTSRLTRYGRISIQGTVSGTTYIDMLELREVKKCRKPEVILDKIKDSSPKKKKPVLTRADGTPI